MNHIITSLLSIFTLTACMGGPQFMQKSMDSNERTREVDATIVEQVAGVVVGQFEARSDATQVMSVSDSSAVQGAKITIPPHALAISTSISIEEGASIALDSVVQNATGNTGLGVVGTTNAVMVTSTVPMDLAKPMTIQLALPSGSSLLTPDLSHLSVVYKVRKEATNQWIEGLIPSTLLVIDQKTITFTTSHFGTFQAVFLTAPVTQAATEIVAATPAISKTTENSLPEIVWTDVNARFIATERSVKVSVQATGHQAVISCEVIGDSDQAAPFDMRQEFKSLSTATFAIKSQGAESYAFRWACEEQNGRRSQSAWSQKVEVPKTDNTSPTPANQAPTINITQPSSQTFVGENGVVTISFTAFDPDDVATIKLLYKNEQTACDKTLSGWTELVSNLNEGTTTSYNWNLSSMPTGSYYICAVISDKLATSYAMSQAPITKPTSPPASNSAVPPALGSGNYGNYTVGISITPYRFINTGAAASSCFATPALPTGLAINAVDGTCEITGAPTTAAVATTYNITATAADGLEGTTSITITVNNSNPPVFSGTNTARVLLQNVVMADIQITNSGGTLQTCTMNPSLPGVSVSVSGNNCVLSGTPSEIRSSQPYTIMGTSIDNLTATTTINLTVDAANPPSLADLSTETFKVEEYKFVEFPNSGANVTTCSVSPTLPQNIDIMASSNTCKISGTPLSASPATIYTVTAISSDGSTDTATVSILINQNPPMFSPVSAIRAISGVAISEVLFGNSGGTVTNCSVTPALPDGLNVTKNGNSCKIFGTPTVASSSRLYTLRGLAADSSEGTTTFKLSVGTYGYIHNSESQRAIFFDSSTEKYWKAYLKSSVTIVIASSEDGVAWTERQTFSTNATSLSIAHASGLLFIVTNDNDGVTVGRIDLTAATLTVEAEGEAFTGSGYSHPVATIGPDNKLYVAALYLNGSRTVARIKSASNATTSPFSSFDPYHELNILGNVSPDGIALVSNGNEVIIVAKDQYENIRSFVFNATINHWSEVSGNGTVWNSEAFPDLNDTVRALAFYKGRLYVGGMFTNANGISETSYLAAWDGVNWHTVGSVGGSILALKVHNDALYVGGDFSGIGGNSYIENIGLWNGTSWTTLGSGTNGPVYAIEGIGNDIYIGGSFTQAGGYPANNIAKWSESSWSTLLSGTNNSVFALASINGNLYAGGSFTAAGGMSANRLAKWNGSSWSTLPASFDDGVNALAAKGTELFVGGSFTSPYSYIAKYETSTSQWSGLGSGVNSIVRTLQVIGNNIYAGGTFTSAGGITTNHLARWNGGNWSSLGRQLVGGSLWSITHIGTELITGGSFKYQDVPEVPAKLASFNIGHIQKAKSFSLAPTISGAVLAVTTPEGNQEISRLSGNSWQVPQNFASEAQASTPVQISSTMDGDTIAVVWRKNSGGISYRKLSDGTWNSESLVDQLTDFMLPRTPATIDGSQTILPIMWQDNSVGPNIRTGTAAL